MAYFDNAATTFPKPECVYAAMDQFYRQSGGNAGRGKYALAANAGALIADTRKRLQNLLHAPAKQVIFTPTATIALNMILQGVIQTGVRNVYISPFEHNAVTRVLHHYEVNGTVSVQTLTVNEQLEYDLERIRYQFDEDKPDLLIMSHASNVIGLVTPVEAICSLAKNYGAVTVIDMAQTAGLIDLNVGLEMIDFAAFAGHKTLYGPTGMSGFLMKSDFPLLPVLFGGTGYDSANQDMPSSLPERYEMGTMNISGMAGLNAALQWIEQVGVDNLYSTEMGHRKRLLNLLRNYPFVRIIGDSESAKFTGVVSCLIEGISSEEAGQIFDLQEIAVRTGLHCSPVAHRFLKTFPAGTVRLSVSYWTTEQEFEQLRQALNYLADNL